MSQVSINYMAVFAAGLASWFLGWAWYSALFGKAWRKEMGVTQADMKASQQGGMMGTMFMGLLTAVVMAWVLAYDVSVWRANDFMTALQLTFWIWLGYQATILVDGVLYERRSWKVFAINASYRFCSMLIAALVIAYWK